MRVTAATLHTLFVASHVCGMRLTPHSACCAGEWVEEPASDNMLRAPYVAPVAATSTSRCELDLGAGLLVPVWVFKATDEAKVPSLKLYSLRDAGEEAEADPAHRVVRATSYKRANEEEGSHVAEDERIAGACLGTCTRSSRSSCCVTLLC